MARDQRNPWGGRERWQGPGSKTSVNGRVIPVGQVTEGDICAWRDLAKARDEPNPLFEADCIICGALPPERGRDVTRDCRGGRSFLRLFSGHPGYGGRPAESTWAGIGRPAFTTLVRRMRWDLTPLVSGERGIEAATDLLSALTDRSRARDAGILVLERLDADGPVSSYIESAAKGLGLPIYTYHSWVRPVVRRRDELTYRSIHGSETLRKFALKRRRLGEQLSGEVQLVDRSATRRPLKTPRYRSCRLEDDRTRAGGGALVLHAGEPEWFREMCDRFRAAGRLVLYSLQVGDSILAMQLMLRGGEGMFDLMMVFDQDYARYSSGEPVVLDAIDRFHGATDAHWLDTCTWRERSDLAPHVPGPSHRLDRGGCRRRTTRPFVLPVVLPAPQTGETGRQGLPQAATNTGPAAGRQLPDGHLTSGRT